MTWNDRCTVVRKTFLSGNKGVEAEWAEWGQVSRLGFVGDALMGIGYWVLSLSRVMRALWDDWAHLGEGRRRGSSKNKTNRSSEDIDPVRLGAGRNGREGGSQS